MFFKEYDFSNNLLTHKFIYNFLLDVDTCNFNQKYNLDIRDRVSAFSSIVSRKYIQI